VTVGLNEQDAFLALGVAPVGVTDWMGFENGIGPWAQEAAKAAGDPPELLTNTDGIRFEKIAALRPDGPDDPRSRLLTDLGFELSTEISELFVKDYAGMISEEQVQLLDLDAVAWFATDDEARKLERNRVYTSLDVHEEGRDFVVLDSRPDDAYNAVGAQTVLSMPLALDVLVPALAAAVDGDPATVPLAKD
jgi:iron complex transport system substrate-binding protein